MHPHRYKIVVAAAAVAASLLVAGPALAVTVQVNGQTANLNPAPIMRAGRVLVPLRGVFEQLGATVVYQNGSINATGNNRTVSLRIGSTAATVNGQPQNLDVAPFIIGASTYVPLRFVSQALGANVNWDNANQLVAITTNGAAPPQAAQAPPPNVLTPAPTQSNVTVTVQAPNDGATVTSDKPTIRAQFSGNVDPNTIRVALDGVDVTNQTTRYANGIVYAPSSPLQQMVHRVVVAATDSNGLRFRHAWTFTSGAGAAAAPVALTITAPANGSNVPGTFTVSGRTTPGAQIHLVAGGVATFGGIFQFNTGSTSGDTTADANGNFSHQLNLGAPSGSQIGLTVTSTNRGTGESQQKQLQLRAQ